MRKELDEFEDICIQIKALESQKEALGQKIIEEMQLHNATVSPRLKYGRVTLKSRTIHTYSDDLQAKIHVINVLKKNEELSGDTEKHITSWVEYRKSNK